MKLSMDSFSIAFEIIPVNCSVFPMLRHLHNHYHRTRGFVESSLTHHANAVIAPVRLLILEPLI
jgi:hypothetical protein